MVYSLVLIQALISASFVTAQVNTYVALPEASYSITVQDRPTPAGDEILVQTGSDGDLNIFPGSDRANAIKKAHEGCGKSYDETCIRTLSEAWGHSAAGQGDSKGLSKRLAPLLIAGGVELYGGLVLLLSMFWAHSSDSSGVHIPADEMRKVASSKPAPTTVFKTATDDPSPITVTVPTPTYDDPPSFVQKEDGSVEITIPSSEVDAINRIIGNDRCKSRSKQRRQSNSAGCSDWENPVRYAAADVIKETDLGGFLAKFQGLRVDFRRPGVDDIPLPPAWADVPNELQEIANMLSFFGDAAGATRNRITRLAALISYARVGLGMEITDKITIPFKDLEKEKKKEPEGCNAGKTVWFCGECGGKNPADEGVEGYDDPRKPKAGPGSKRNFFFTCLGRDSSDERKGCHCMEPQESSPFKPNKLKEHMAKVAELYKKPPRKEKKDKPAPPPEAVTSCNKDNPDVRKDPKRWRWAPRDLMFNRVDQFCSGQPGKDQTFGPGPKEDDVYDEKWNSFKFILRYSGKTAPSKAECIDGLTRVLDHCDAHATLNQNNFKWGGTHKDSAGRTYEVIPTYDRIVTNSDFKSSDKVCSTWKNGSDKQMKGKNGEPLPGGVDEQMMKLMVVHHMRDEGFRYYDVGPVEGKGPYFRAELAHMIGYRSHTDCWNNVYECVEDSILRQGGVAFTSTHFATPTLKCWLDFFDY